MGYKVKVEIETVRDAIELLRRRLFEDVPPCPDNEQILLEEATLLIRLILSVYPWDDIYESYVDECDYYEEFEHLLGNLRELRALKLFEKDTIHNLKVVDTDGLMIIHF